MSTAILTGSELEPTSESLALPMEADQALYEFIDGQRVEMPPMSLLATRLGTRLSQFVEAQQLGEIFVEGLFLLPLTEDRSSVGNGLGGYHYFGEMGARPKQPGFG